MRQVSRGAGRQHVDAQARAGTQAMTGAPRFIGTPPTSAAGGSVPVPPDTGLPPSAPPAPPESPPMAPPPAPVDDPSPAATPPAPVGEPPRERPPAAFFTTLWMKCSLRTAGLDSTNG